MPDGPTEARRRIASTRHRTQDVDRHVGARLRDRRLMLGLTQQQLAELIGVTYQQAHKYERGINRISAGRLYQTAQALGVEIGHFFEGLEAGAIPEAAEATSRRRAMIGLARDFLALSDRRHQEALCRLVRDLAGADREEAGPGGGGPGAADRPA